MIVPPDFHRPGRFAYTLLLTFPFVLCGLPLTNAAEPASPIAWHEDLAQAQAESKARDLPLWIQFTGPWCINCRRLDRDTFTNPRMIEHSKTRFIPVRLRSDVHESLAVSLGLSALPATVIVRPNGEVILSQQGYADPDEFDTFLTTALRKDGRMNRIASSTPSARTANDHDEPDSPRPPVEGSPRVEPLALAGFCPVALVQDHRLLPGRADLEVRFDGQRYRFSESEHRDIFLRRPLPFLPVGQGSSPVGQVERGEIAPGDPHWGVLYRGHLYLCRDSDERAQFLRNPDRYAHADLGDRGHCRHCWDRDGLFIWGTPAHAAIIDGRRFWHPDPGLLSAFLMPPDQRRR